MFVVWVVRYWTVPPAPQLRSLIECHWVRVTFGPVPTDVDRILPDGRVDLVWLEGSGVLVAGPQTRYTPRPGPPPPLVFGARFHPGAAPRLLGLPASELVDTYVPLDALDRRLATRLDRRLGLAGDEAEGFAVLDEELIASIGRLSEPDPIVATAVGMLRGGSTRIGEVAASVYLSERQLHRRFRHHVGYGPKTLQRILRFQGVLAELARGDGVELARVAAVGGYADQSHLHRESRRLAGLNPSELARRAG